MKTGSQFVCHGLLLLLKRTLPVPNKGKLKIIFEYKHLFKC